MTSAPTDADLYVRGVQTLLASWQAYAGGSRDAAVLRFPGVTTAVFPSEPERAFYNNALLERGLRFVGAGGGDRRDGSGVCICRGRSLRGLGA